MMKQAINASGASLIRRTEHSPTRCSICAHRLGRMIYQIEDEFASAPGDLPDVPLDDAPSSALAPRKWALCKDCYAAVEREVRRARLQSPHRVHVAIGLIASERSPSLRPHFWEESYWNIDKNVEKWLWWTIMIVAFGHMVFFAIIMLWPAIEQFFASL